MAQQWFEVMKTADFPACGWAAISVANENVVLFLLDDKFYAIENMCTHDGGMLAGGPVIGNEVVCPRHGARFCIKTGQVTAPPAYEDVRSFPVKIENELIFLGFEI